MNSNLSKLNICLTGTVDRDVRKQPVHLLESGTFTIDNGYAFQVKYTDRVNPIADGLGLEVAQHFVEIHNAWVEARS